MRKSLLLGGLTLVLLGATSGQALANSVCYAIGDADDPNGIVRLDVKFHSPLTTVKERLRFDHPTQRTYSAHGKLVTPLELLAEEVEQPVEMRPINGTVTVAKGVGARSGLTSPSGGTLLAFDCASDQASATPDTWQCSVLDVGGGGAPDNAVLTRVNPLDEPLCSRFALPEPNNGPPPCDQPGGVCTVFVTSSQQNGNLGGLSGADQICNTLADQAGLPGAGGYLAWLSDADESPSTRFDQSAGSYRLVDGTVVANGWADLTDGTLQNPIDVLEDGTPVTTGTAVWTATQPDGTLAGPITIGGPFCEEWTDGAFERAGKRGSSLASDADWTLQGTAGTVPCNRSDLRLYCFQQP